MTTPARTTRRRVFTLSLLFGALTITACSETVPAVNDPHAELQDEMRRAGALLMDELKPLFATPEGRLALESIAAEHDNLFFDGVSRFAQFSTTDASGTPAAALEMISEGPDTFSRAIRFLGPVQPTRADLRFDTTTANLIIFYDDQNDEEERDNYDFDWTPGTLAPFGTINIDRGTANFNYGPFTP